MFDVEHSTFQLEAAAHTRNTAPTERNRDERSKLERGTYRLGTAYC